mmetsp:Transcript_4131/g.15992  ORF Transcript_4131/g.15992 Transcript_4131/m.15992 type:complete len:217 (-) Transcript_4131:62-712(-)
MSPMASSLYVEMITLTDSMARWKFWYSSSAGSCSSSSARSTLFTMSTGLTRSVMAWRSTVSVCTQTPSMVSTTTSAPSVTRRAAVTSEEKSTCPGESMRLMRKDLSLIWMSSPAASMASALADSTSPCSKSYSKNMDTPVDLMVTPRSCSSARVSVKRASPAALAEMIPALDTSESVSVDLPWSTCAITLMLRMLCFRSIMARSCSTVKFTMVEKR